VRSLPRDIALCDALPVALRAFAERVGVAMTEVRWKLSVDQQGVTIANDRFQLTTAGSNVDKDFTVDHEAFEMAQPSQIETIVAQLESMTRRTYGQYCGLARAMELVGERWTLLIVRDLSVRPKSVADLQRGLPRIPQETLFVRIRELEYAGVIARQPAADDSVVYELTEYGGQLEDILLRFSRWGTQMLGDPRPEEIVTTDSLVVAMRSTFNPDAAHGVDVSYEIRVGSDKVLHIRVGDGIAHVGPGPLPDADMVFEPGVLLKKLMSGEVTAAEAIETGSVRFTGEPGLLQLFTELFAIPYVPPTSKV
jgi:DNA-binding HxlR family transcriptional regulator